MTQSQTPTGAGRTPEAAYHVTVTRALGRRVIRLAGSVDWQDMPTLRVRLLALPHTREPTLVDLSALDFADSSLLHLLLDLQRLLRADGGSLHLGGELRPVPRRLFAVTGVGGYFDVAGVPPPAAPAAPTGSARVPEAER
ncbi:STAS domain-containing protein [Streptomyces sp. NPDC048566]|uniref:STAS domain-containing protein n=1 Tax=Streptomyces sp. NPDC048566 TaxID=3365569 RepID=UPI0037180D35